MATPTIQNIVARQISKVLRKGSNLGKFDQIRVRQFWSTYLFIADPATNKIATGSYDIFKAIPGSSGQGYPTNTNLTMRETNWLNAGRVPDNQSFAITEIGATIRTPPLENPGAPATTGIYSALTAAQKTYLLPGVARALPAIDAYNIASGVVLEMSSLTNNVPLGLIGDFSQSGGIITPANNHPVSDANDNVGLYGMANGIPAAAFRRRFEIPILLSSGQNMGMRLTIAREIDLLNPTNTVVAGSTHHGKGWFEICVDWWAIESFIEKS